MTSRTNSRAIVATAIAMVGVRAKVMVVMIPREIIRMSICGKFGDGRSTGEIRGQTQPHFDTKIVRVEDTLHKAT